MKPIAFLLFTFLVLFSSCDNHKRELALQKKEAELNQREQELVLREKTVQLKEEELAAKKLKLDSSINTALKDSGTYNPDLVGTWSVKMNCIETNCPGSAVGDTKTEQWQLSYQNNAVIAKAIVNKKLVRVYSGVYANNILELTVQQNDETAQEATQMVVHLQPTDKDHLEGKREITSVEDCKIIYALDMVKQQVSLNP